MSLQEQKDQNNKNQLNWLDIPKQYESKINEINDDVIEGIYSKLSFKYYMFNESQNNNNDNKYFASFMFNYLIKHNFIIFRLTDERFSINCNSKLQISSKTNCVICIEGECIIIEQINISLLQNIFSELKGKQISLINVGKNPNHKFVQAENEAKEEIQKFCEHFQKTIKQNSFVSYTIDSIAGYLIRRYYFQTSYFKDPSFFYFDRNTYLIERRIKQNLNDCIFSENNNIKTVESIEKDFDIIRKSADNIPKYKFNEDDFIKLRTLYSKTDSAIYKNTEFHIHLVIHIKTLYVFCMKKFIYPILNEAENHEINFSNYSHRSFVRCYGLVTKNDKAIGLIYEFMSNGSIDNYIKHNDVEYFYLLNTILRIINGIGYLQKNQQIHRDLKPLNIFIDHDNLPYISDFETVRLVSNENTKTQDIGSQLYASPEQDKGLNVSYPTDIYSFGLIVYFLFEKEDMFEGVLDKIEPKKMTKGSSIIQNIYLKCVKYEPEQRITCNEIKTIFNNILNFFDEYLINGKYEMEFTQIINFIYEKK